MKTYNLDLANTPGVATGGKLMELFAMPAIPAEARPDRGSYDAHLGTS